MGDGSSSESVNSVGSPLSTSNSASSESSSSSCLSTTSASMEKPGMWDQCDEDKYRAWVQSIPSFELQQEHRRAKVTKRGQVFGMGVHAVTSPVSGTATAGASLLVHAGSAAYHNLIRSLNAMQQKVCEEEMAKRGLSDLDLRKRDVAKIAVSVIPKLDKLFG